MPRAATGSTLILQRRLRLVSGLVLAFFILTHGANHALGLVSVEMMEAGRRPFVAVWRSLPGTVLLYGAFVVHFVLSLKAVLRRRTLRMPAGEVVQAVFGLLVPVLLAPHVLMTRWEYEITGAVDSYALVVRYLWIDHPGSGLSQGLLLLLVWVHGCIGLALWLRYRPWFARWSSLLLVFAVLLPLLSTLGFIQAGRDLARRPAPEAPYQGRRFTSADAVPTELAFLGIGLLALVWVAAGRLLPLGWGRVRVRYPGGRSLTVPVGTSVLEASRMGGIEHVSACGGKGRCSTCRVAVVEGLAGLPAMAELERATLSRIAALDGTVRLACQLRPATDLGVVPLLDARRPAAGRGGAAVVRHPGEEREIAVLFCDLRGSTQLAERILPFDLVHVVNAFFEAVGHAVIDAGGLPAQAVGDEMMAIFGLDVGPDQACRQAWGAALAAAKAIRGLTPTLPPGVEGPLRFAMGLQVGPAVVGDIGFGGSVLTTALGDTANTAHRLSTCAKDLDADMTLSAAAATYLGAALADHPRAVVPIRGKAEPLAVVNVMRLPAA